MPKLKDEQLQVINHEQGNILISASAGSGKTFVMVERLIRLIIEKKTSVANVLCVTFTEAAATEMKEKIKRAIAKKISEGVDLTEELLLVDNADISTIHSFCSKLIRRYFFIAGISPDYKIVDEAKAKALKNESLDRTFNKLYALKDKDFLFVLKRYKEKRADGALKKLILSMHDDVNKNADTEKYINETLKIYEDIDYANAKYKEYILPYFNLVKNGCYDLEYKCKALGFEQGLKHLGIISNYADEVINGDIYTVLKYGAYKITKSYGTKLDEEKLALKEEINALYGIIEGVYKRVLGYVTDINNDAKIGLELKSHIEKLIKIVKLFDEEYSDSKREENLLDFADLERFALKILRDEETLNTIKNQYSYVFADEYQDVNDVQEELLSKISNDNLFMVGDVKQSIYGFRGSRPEIFENKEKEMKARKEKTVRLNHNFRSAPAVLDMANEIFSYSMTSDLYGVDYFSTARLIPGGIYPEDMKGRTALYLLEKASNSTAKEERTKVYDLLKEAEKEKINYPSNVALLIESIIRKELKNKFYDTKLNKERFVTYSDIALLNKNRDNDYVSKTVQDLLRLNIPVSAEVTVNVLDFAEIQTLISILSLIDCKRDDVSLVSVLKSPVGNFTEEELLKIAILYKDYLSTLPENERPRRTFYNSYVYALINAKGELKEKLKKFNDYIDSVRIKADFLGAGEILKKVIAECSITDHLIAKGDAEEKFKRISFFIKKALDGKKYTVHEFLEFIKNSTSAFDMSPSATENAVKVMTIHKSKGLEFPVVILFGLEKPMTKRGEYSEDIFSDNTLGFCPKSYDDEKKVTFENFFRGLFVEKKRIDKLKEDLRLLYVGTTRASYSMHLTLEASKDKRKNTFLGANTFVDYIPNHLETITVTPEELMAKDEERKGKRDVLVGESDKLLKEKIKNNLQYVYPHNDSTTLPVKCSVTKATKEVKDEQNVIHYVTTDEETGINRGITAHKILEMLNFDTLDNDDFTSQVKNMVENNILTNEDVSLVDLSKLESAVLSFKDRVKGKKLYREQNFIALLDSKTVLDRAEEGVLVQGIIDLLVVGDDGAEIIDYKYSSLKGENLKTRYLKQLDLYALAVENSLKIKVNKKTLVNVLSGECIDF